MEPLTKFAAVVAEQGDQIQLFVFQYGRVDPDLPLRVCLNGVVEIHTWFCAV